MSRRLLAVRVTRNVVGMCNVTGVTELNSVMYVISSGSCVIRTYNADTFSPLGRIIHVEGMTDPCDIVACRHGRQLYVTDLDLANSVDCVWQVSTDNCDQYERWLVFESRDDNIEDRKLSVTSEHLLVTSHPRSLYQYNTTNKRLLRTVRLPEYVEELWHGTETLRGTFVVAYSGTAKKLKLCAVCKERSRHSFVYS